MIGIEDRIGIPPCTKFVALFRLKDSWLAWIAVRDMQARYADWQGTYLQLHDNGGITRVTVYDDGHEEAMIIK